MRAPVVIIGMGELGGEFARGLLKLGHPIHPVLRGADLAAEAAAVPAPALVLVTVGEDDLPPLMARLPETWRNRVGLVQNELLPRDWIRHDIADPTVMVVWFEKKPGKITRALMPSPVHGPATGLLADALERIDIPVARLASPEDLERELVAKNLYILTNNSCGLEVGGTVDTLWSTHRALADRVSSEVLALQAALTGHTLSRDPLIEIVLAGVRGGADHKTMGRTAPKRLRRALALADEAGLAVPELRRLAATYLVGDSTTT